MSSKTAIVAALAAALATPAAAQQRASAAGSPDRVLGEKRAAAPDASLAGSIEPAQPASTAPKGPALDFEKFRYAVEGQVSGKRRQEIADLEKLVRLGGSEQEMPGWLFRLGELHWEESQYLFFEANRRDDAIVRAGGPNAPEAARLRAEKADLEKGSRAEQARAIERYREIARRYPGWNRLDEVVFFLGENLWKQNRRAEALDAYKALLTRFPKSRFVADAWIAVGESWFDQAERGDRATNLARALESYKRAAAVSNSSVGGYAVYKQAWVHYNLGQWQQALALFEEVARRGAQAGADREKSLALAREARKDYVRTYVHVGSPAGAPDVFRRVGGDEHARDMLKGLAGLYYESGKDREAILTYHRLISQGADAPDAPLFQSRIVTAAGRLGRKDLAAAQARAFVGVLQRAESSAASKTEDGRHTLEVARREAENTLRTLAVQYHNEWKKTRDAQVAALAESLYRDHLQLFPSGPNAHDLRFFHAELLFALRRFQEAGDEYGRVVESALAQPRDGAKAPKYLVEALESSVHSYGELARAAGGAERKPAAGEKRVPFGPQDKQLVDACERYLKYAPNGDKAVEVAYQAAQLYYQHNAFAEAVPLFTRVATDHPQHELARYAANLALDALNLSGNYRDMNALALRLVRNERLLQAQPALREDLGKVVEQSAFKLVEELEKSKKNAEAAAAWLAFARDWRTSKLAPTALHNAAVSFVAAGRLEEAMAARAELLQRYPNHPLVPKALAATAQDHAAAADFEQAAALWERYFAEWRKSTGTADAARGRRKQARPAKAAAPANPPEEAPKWEEAVARDAIHDAGVLREGLGQYRKAEQDRLAYLEAWPKSKEAPRVFLSIADLYAKQGDASREARHVREYQKKYAPSADDWLAAQNRILRALERAGDTAAARRAAAEAVAFWKVRKGKVSDRGLWAVAQGMLLDLDDDFAAYDAIKFDGGPRRLQARLGEKAKRLEALQRAYTDVVELKQPEPAVCALWKIGDAYRRFGAALRDAPLPPEIKRDRELAAEYRKQLATFAEEPERKGFEGTELAVAKARELGVANACARDALKLAAQRNPAEYAPPDEVLPDDQAARAQGGARDADVLGADLERELDADATRDSDPIAMLKEAKADLAAGQAESAWRRVRLSLLKAPQAPAAFPILMGAALQMKKPDLAHLVAMRAERAGVATPEITFLRGRAYQLQKQEALARAEWMKAADAGYGDARRALLRVEFANRNWPGVAVHAHAIVEKHPDDAVAHLAYGVAQRHANRPDDALAAYAKAEKLSGGTLAEVHFARAILFARVKGQCDDATAELRRYAEAAGPEVADSSGAVLARDCERARAAPRAVPAASATEGVRPSARPTAGAAAASVGP